MAKNEKRQTIVHITQHRKLKNKQHEPHKFEHENVEMTIDVLL